jgi:hypothetical protein
MLRWLLIVTLFFISCKTTSSTAKKHILNFGSFTIETPGTWKEIKMQGVDSYVGRIAMSAGQFAEFDLGWYSSRLIDEDDPGENSKYRIQWDTVDGRKSKIVSPKRNGNGITGIYIDSLWGTGPEKDRFSFSGNNLDPINQKLFLIAIKTIKFYHK